MKNFPINSILIIFLLIFYFKQEDKINIKLTEKEIDLLEVGDIILVQNNELVSSILRSVDGDFKFSHIGVIIERNNEKVVFNVDAINFFEKNTIQTIKLNGFIEDSKKLGIYRLKEKFDKEKLNQLIEYYEKYSDTYYFDWFASLNNNSFYCVELIRELFLKQNINITNKAKIKRNNMEVFFPSDINFELFNLILEKDNNE